MEPIFQAEQLRDTFLRNLTKTKEWEIVKAADDMVAALGGERKLPVVGGVRVVGVGGIGGPAARHYGGGAPRISHGDTAEMVLREVGEPLTVGALLERMEAKGAVVGGEKKEINLSSSLSRDDRFISVRVEGIPVWTLTAEDFLPPVQQRRAIQIEDDDL